MERRAAVGSRAARWFAWHDPRRCDGRVRWRWTAGRGVGAGRGGAAGAASAGGGGGGVWPRAAMLAAGGLRELHRLVWRLCASRVAEIADKAQVGSPRP